MPALRFDPSPNLDRSILASLGVLGDPVPDPIDPGFVRSAQIVDVEVPVTIHGRRFLTTVRRVVNGAALAAADDGRLDRTFISGAQFY